MASLRWALAAVAFVIIASASADAAPADATIAPPAPCYGTLNSTFRYEEACYKVLHSGTGGLSLREYSAATARGGVTLVTYNASSSITIYQEALEETGYYVRAVMSRAC